MKIEPSYTFQPNTPEMKKKVKGGDIVRYESQDLSLVNVDHVIRVSFEKAGCISFCEKIHSQGHHFQLTKQFALNFKGKEVKVRSLVFVVFEKSIVVVTDIPLHGEEWFKGMELDLSHIKDFLQPQYQEGYGSVIPRSYLMDHHSKLLKVILSYFTCEGRFSKIYQYHIKLLMHFIGKKALNFSYYLFRSLRKMFDKVQEMGNNIEPSLFHFSLIKLLVLKELDKREHSWQEFLISSGWVAQSSGSLKSKRDTPSVATKEVSSTVVGSVKWPLIKEKLVNK